MAAETWAGPTLSKGPSSQVCLWCPCLLLADSTCTTITLPEVVSMNFKAGTPPTEELHLARDVGRSFQGAKLTTSRISISFFFCWMTLNSITVFFLPLALNFSASVPELSCYNCIDTCQIAGGISVTSLPKRSTCPSSVSLSYLISNRLLGAGKRELGGKDH